MVASIAPTRPDVGGPHRDVSRYFAGEIVDDRSAGGNGRSGESDYAWDEGRDES